VSQRRTTSSSSQPWESQISQTLSCQISNTGTGNETWVRKYKEKQVCSVWRLALQTLIVKINWMCRIANNSIKYIQFSSRKVLQPRSTSRYIQHSWVQY
jgi:hypothetical protein